MRKSLIASLSALLTVGAISLPLLAGCTTTAPRTGPATGKQLAELKGSDTVVSDEFGISVAVSGTTAVVGTSGSSYAGRAYVFTRTASGWKQAAELKGSDTNPGDNFGSSVAISGTTVVVGAYRHAKDAGRAYVFTKTASGWKQAAELKGSGNVTKDGFGTSVAVSGTTAVVSAEGHANGAGAAYVFTGTATGWDQAAELKGSHTVAGDNFGSSVAISGTTAVVSAYGQANSAGSAYVFTETAGVWKQAAELKGSDTTAGDYFGISAAISGTTVVVGAYDHANLAGRAYLFTKTASGWKQTEELKGSDVVANDNFGISVAVSGTAAVVGAYGDGTRAGRAFVFRA
jgi:hypothetical protein